jgi:5'-3' exonuclease
MANTYILVDTANTFFRARHVVRGSLEDKVGMSLATVLGSVRKAWKDFKGTHVIFCLEGRSWRKDHYEPYKRQRAEARASHSPREQEEEKVFWETFDQFKDFIINKTNCTVLHHQQLEADDLIAGFIQAHPNDSHVIISTDGDFAQLIAPNVRQYNGVMQITTTHEGYFDEKGKPVKDKKTNEPKGAPDPAWLLFEKCMRGDTSDNIFSAYPGVREKGTKNKVGLREAFADRESKGYNWNNMMLQRWTDHEGVEHRVLDDYNRNVVLCDLTAQPDDIKTLIKETINTAATAEKNIPQVGVRLLKFCAEYDLQKISEQVTSYAEPLNARYVL